ncbi:NADH:flavin oxidoreductase [Pseudomonas sp. LTJR-52]|uniref:NADH:flavin oxidoreductase n=1 Tax=Pseudomonas sp. LTJR-52 TaxID=2479392 RepID=UPI000EFCC54B|nr:NADH:flavin oxidoreductase [Pseudomonas sp. LTJR-52]AYN96413.1 NADH:flavin oxidoreductase [Pseudomonas sp. LTJR-52]
MVKTLFTHFDINGVSLNNRLAVAPMTRVSANEDGTPNDTMNRYYERFARGGFGLIITEGLYTDQAYAQGYAYQPGMSDNEQAQAWKPLVDTLHAQDSKVFAQLMHAGALTQGNRFRNDTLAPSALQPKGEQMAFYRGQGFYPLPKAMTEADIADVISSFAQAAKRAVEVAGFDGIEIHGANGYLLDQFFTDYTNMRDDRWGGDIRQRLSLSLEVYKAVRSAVGANVPVGIRISQGKVNDFEHKWKEGEAGAEIVFGTLAEAGIDFIHVTEHEAWQPAFGEGPSLVALARRYAPTVTVIANGKLHDPERAAQALEDGADLIAIGRGALANADWPQKVENAQALAEFDPSLLGPIAHIKASETL